jgi:DNA-binding response OmpR family regulator
MLHMKPTILIVDDDTVLCRVLGRVLNGQGYHVVPATDAAEALGLSRVHPPRLALIDLCLPDQEGMALARELRARWAGLPLILMTACPLQRARRAELDAVFSSILIKPLDLKGLRGAVEAALLRTAGAEGWGSWHDVPPVAAGHGPRPPLPAALPSSR